jgi:glutamate N-acetyltransferase/amino-acid N-acetyltransferase
MSSIEIIEGGSVTSPAGYYAAGVACGIKANGALDLALIHSAGPCVGAAMFTTNLFKAAPVLYDQRTLEANPAGLRTVVINSGCANACTGAPGLGDAEATAAAASAALGVAGEDVMVMSTGVIGARLPMERLLAGVKEAALELSDAEEAGHTAARAIMTTDTRPKESAVRISVDDVGFTIAGMIKGAGMIHPNMATLLCLVTTDALITQDLARQALSEAVDETLHRITIDGDTSTNDTVLLLANGRADMPAIVAEDTEAYEAFVRGLSQVLADLAKAVVRDGEGATRFIEISVRGAKTRGEARQVGMSIARSLLVKTAIYGQDANWGRIICAAGYSGVAFDPDKVGVWLGDLELVRAGAPYHIDEARAAEILAQSDIPIVVDLGQGPADATVWTCDLSHGYVDVNAHYRT